MNRTLREECAQMVLAEYRFESPDYDQAIVLAKAGVGGFCLFGGSIFDLASMINALQRHAKFPLLFASDYENGVGQQVGGATVLPSNMAVAATRSMDLAKKKGRITAIESAALGVRWVLAPVLDLNTHPRNPIINTRSFGDDPGLTTKMARAFLEGLHEKKVIGCGKHFPGHGDVEVDSHRELPTVHASLETLRTGELHPYSELTKELDSVMTGHLMVPSLDLQNPASLSKAITEGLLRKEFRYEGLICTDALMMGAMQSIPDAVVSAAVAGADVLVLPKASMTAIQDLESAVQSGRLSGERVKSAAERILSVKQRLGLFEDKKVDAGAVEKYVGIQAHRDVAQEIADASITLVKGDGVVQGNVFYVHVADPENVPGDLTVFEKHLSTGIGRMVIGIYSRPRAFSGTIGLSDHLIQRVRASLKQDPEAILVSFGSPYVIQHFPEAKHYVCAYSECEASQRAAAWAIQGKIPFRGVIPVNLRP